MANRRTAMRWYTKFARKFGRNYKCMSQDDVVTFIEYLCELVKSPDTVKQYIFAVRTCLKKMKCDVQVFDQEMVKDAMQAVPKTIRHIPDPTKPISPELLEECLWKIDDSEVVTIRCFIVVSYCSLFRQSTISPRSKNSYDKTRHITRADIKHLPGGRYAIKQKWSKSEQCSLYSHEDIPLPVIKDSILCPTAAIRLMLAVSPTRKHDQSLISFRDGQVMPVSYVERRWNQVLRLLGIRHRDYTLHCLRKGGAKVLQDITGDDQCIKDYGGWRSTKGMRAYVKDKAKARACAAFETLGKPKSRTSRHR